MSGAVLNADRLSLDKRLADIFPEHISEELGDNLKKMAIRHFLYMRGGMETACEMDENRLKGQQEGGASHCRLSQAPSVCRGRRRRERLLHWKITEKEVMLYDFLRRR